jgi:hypothetical protein
MGTDCDRRNDRVDEPQDRVSPELLRDFAADDLALWNISLLSRV